MTSGKFVTLGWYVDLPQARRAADRLKAAGIPSYLRGEAAALIASKSVDAGIRLDVAEEDLEHAQLVLAAPEGEVKRSGKALPDSDSETRGLMTVEVFYDPLEAKHSADLLRAHGIPCSLHGTSEGVLPGLFGGLPTMKLDVLEDHFDRACEILGFRLDKQEAADESTPDVSWEGSEHIKAHEPRSPREIKQQPPHLQPDTEVASQPAILQT